ncbi:collagen alpha-1(I) chain-like, partial [Varanus komodoensis]|uniref:collagen alpha-1(I) chain-like n=1 Tax=Varanus komodoensis TaxID=61221 RepID=UPI001CF77FCA
MAPPTAAAAARCAPRRRLRPLGGGGGGGWPPCAERAAAAEKVKAGPRTPPDPGLNSGVLKEPPRHLRLRGSQAGGGLRAGGGAARRGSRRNSPRGRSGGAPREPAAGADRPGPPPGGHADPGEEAATPDQLPGEGAFRRGGKRRVQIPAAGTPAPRSPALPSRPAAHLQPRGRGLSRLGGTGDGALAYPQASRARALGRAFGSLLGPLRFSRGAPAPSAPAAPSPASREAAEPPAASGRPRRRAAAEPAQKRSDPKRGASRAARPGACQLAIPGTSRCRSPRNVAQGPGNARSAPWPPEVAKLVQESFSPNKRVDLYALLAQPQPPTPPLRSQQSSTPARPPMVAIPAEAQRCYKTEAKAGPRPGALPGSGVPRAGAVWLGRAAEPCPHDGASREAGVGCSSPEARQKPGHRSCHRPDERVVSGDAVCAFASVGSKGPPDSVEKPQKPSGHFSSLGRALATSLQGRAAVFQAAGSRAGGSSRPEQTAGQAAALCWDGASAQGAGSPEAAASRSSVERKAPSDIPGRPLAVPPPMRRASTRHSLRRPQEPGARWDGDGEATGPVPGRARQSGHAANRGRAPTARPPALQAAAGLSGFPEKEQVAPGGFEDRASPGMALPRGRPWMRPAEAAAAGARTGRLVSLQSWSDGLGRRMAKAPVQGTGCNAASSWLLKGLGQPSPTWRLPDGLDYNSQRPAHPKGIRGKNSEPFARPLPAPRSLGLAPQRAWCSRGWRCVPPLRNRPGRAENPGCVSAFLPPPKLAKGPSPFDSTGAGLTGLHWPGGGILTHLQQLGSLRGKVLAPLAAAGGPGGCRGSPDVRVQRRVSKGQGLLGLAKGRLDAGASPDSGPAPRRGSLAPSGADGAPTPEQTGLPPPPRWRFRSLTCLHRSSSHPADSSGYAHPGSESQVDAFSMNEPRDPPLLRAGLYKSPTAAAEPTPQRAGGGASWRAQGLRSVPLGSAAAAAGAGRGRRDAPSE